MRSESIKEIEESNASKGKKRKVDFENRGFNKYWEDKYMFVEYDGRPTCLVCAGSVAVAKEFNIRRHYETKHIKNMHNFKGLCVQTRLSI